VKISVERKEEEKTKDKTKIFNDYESEKQYSFKFQAPGCR
jgi:hypothetical protein